MPRAPNVLIVTIRTSVSPVLLSLSFCCMFFTCATKIGSSLSLSAIYYVDVLNPTVLEPFDDLRFSLRRRNTVCFEHLSCRCLVRNKHWVVASKQRSAYFLRARVRPKYLCRCLSTNGFRRSSPPSTIRSRRCCTTFRLKTLTGQCTKAWLRLLHW